MENYCGLWAIGQITKNEKFMRHTAARTIVMIEKFRFIWKWKITVAFEQLAKKRCSFGEKRSFQRTNFPFLQRGQGGRDPPKTAKHASSSSSSLLLAPPQHHCPQLGVNFHIRFTSFGTFRQGFHQPRCCSLAHDGCRKYLSQLKYLHWNWPLNQRESESFEKKTYHKSKKG